jgi:hypothetical protein
MNKWTGKDWEELRVQLTKNYWKMVYEAPDLTKPLLTPWEQEQCASDPIFKQKIDNMNRNEIAEWNTKQLKFWNEAHHE